LIGAARILAVKRDSGLLPSGTIRFIFQPSEEATDDEGKSGAMRMVDEGVMAGVDAVVGLHLGGPLPAGKIFFAAGPIMAGAAEIHIEVLGKSSHAGMPEAGVDALVLAARGVVAAQDSAPKDRSPVEDGLISFGQISGGTATNVLADRVAIGGTMRFFSEETRERLNRRLDEAFGVLEESGAKVTIDVETGILPVINDDRVTTCVRAAVIDLVGEDDVLPIEPITLAEDFSFLAKEAPGTFFGSGQPSPSLGCTMNPTSISTKRRSHWGPPRCRPAPSAFSKRWGKSPGTNRNRADLPETCSTGDARSGASAGSLYAGRTTPGPLRRDGQIPTSRRLSGHLAILGRRCTRNR